METKYIYNPETLSYSRVPFIKYYKKYLIFGLTIFLFGVILGIYLTQPETNNHYNPEDELHVMPSKHDVIIGTNEWKDSVFNDYEMRANLYLARDEFTGTPIQAQMLALAAHNAYDSTGILLPVELALAQCQWESGMGLKGKSPINNPYNVGEYDSGTVLWFNNTFDGIQAYYYLMCNNYLSCHSLSELFTNFVNCNGKRYASGQYENHVPAQYYYIKRWLKKELENNSFSLAPEHFFLY